MSQWRLNDDDFEDYDDYSKTNVEKKADAPWTHWGQGHFKVAIIIFKMFFFFKNKNQKKSKKIMMTLKMMMTTQKKNVEKKADTLWTHWGQGLVKDAI